jgi:hypothetical protein
MKKLNVPKYQPSQYKTKFDAVADMLKGGETVKQIKNRMLVSDSYIYLAKKKLKEAAAKAIKETILSVDNTVYPDITSEFAFSLSQGRQKRKEIEEAAAALKEACTFTPNKEDVGKILNERGANYGTFLGLSQVTQRLKGVAHQFAGQHNKTFDADQAEALDMIFTKIGRILNGDANHTDSWIDIAGYATLVADRLQGKSR